MTLIVLLHLMPIPLALGAAWWLWRLGNGRPRGGNVGLTASCRACGRRGWAEMRTHRCAACFAEPLPTAEAVPDRLPEELWLELREQPRRR